MKISNRYFSGFCFQGEAELFTPYLEINDFTISGFSYGAIKAFEEVYNLDTRIDKLQLFSPSFFQTKDKKFKRTQLMFFKKDEKSYINNFMKNVSFPQNIDLSKYLKIGTFEELEELLSYEWSEEKLQNLIDRGIKIEVFLGSEDKIIDSLKAKEFFVNYATVYYIKEKGHIL